MSAEVWSHSGYTQTTVYRNVTRYVLVFNNIFTFVPTIETQYQIYTQIIHSTKTRQNFGSLCEQCWIWMTFEINQFGGTVFTSQNFCSEWFKGNPRGVKVMSSLFLSVLRVAGLCRLIFGLFCTQRIGHRTDHLCSCLYLGGGWFM